MSSAKDIAVSQLMSLRRLHPAELVPWICAVVVWFFFPTYLPFATQIVIMILFTLSYDIVVGYAGIIILGHTAFFGVGAYSAGLLTLAGWQEPISGLLMAGIAAAAVGITAGAIILRTAGLTLLMLGLALTLLFGELANRFPEITGGHDGLQGITTSPIFGRFDFDLFGHVTFIYSVAVLFVAWVAVRALVHAPFGRSLVGIRLNPARMQAIGVPVRQRKLVAFTISAGLAGVAGALSAQTTQFVSLDAFGLGMAGTVLIILVIGGRGRLYGAFIGAPAYMIVQDALAKDDPVFWLFWLGIILILVVLFAPNGLLGLFSRAGTFLKSKWKSAATDPRQPQSERR
ncbi:branched-chain amino acid ABC transporter permease [Bradyrhizobium sp. dw_78]|uniref:branched-chain amino acid ABC transporter permease n=1 Tax=Bradyrhizobium sp. dw_78 TaxID=2719793 RepID=UPI001BD4B031|nr:branched-chain amino acid ABC transporter permease [Bradyrhizobium sp. dw_78]